MLEITEQEENIERAKDRLFSSLAARLLFLSLLIATFFWILYAVSLYFLVLLFNLLTGFQVDFLNRIRGNAWLSLKRSCVCSVCLFLTLFSPGFGIMIACTYFLMYDREGIDDIVPSSLQSQFKGFFK